MKKVFIFIMFFIIFTEGHLTKFGTTKGHRRLKRLGTADIERYKVVIARILKLFAPCDQ